MVFVNRSSSSTTWRAVDLHHQLMRRTRWTCSKKVLTGLLTIKKGQQCETFRGVQKGSGNEANADVLVRGLKLGHSFSCYATL